MTEKDLTPEQRVAMETLMKECRSVVNKTVAFSMLLMAALTFANISIGKYFGLDKTAVMCVQFLTVILTFSSTYRQLIEISDEFVAEGHEILKKKD